MASPTPSILTPTSIRNLTLLLRTAPRSTRSYFQYRNYSSSSSSSPPSSITHSNSSPFISPTEISHFNALASTWWDPHGPSRLLHLMNPLRHSFIRSCHASQPKPPPQSLRYLDVGCGGGIFAESAARLAATEFVTGIDPSPDVLAVARSHARRDPGLAEKLTYLNMGIEGLPVLERSQEKGDSGGVDVLTVFEVVEHVRHPAEFLDACAKHVRPGGWMVLSTIARHWISWVTTKVMAEDLLWIVPRGTHDWEKYINEDELRAYFAGKGGWNSWRCMGVVYVPGIGWREVTGSEKVGNYFFGARKDET